MAFQFWIGREGAALRARLIKSTSPLEAFYCLFINFDAGNAHVWDEKIK